MSLASVGGIVLVAAAVLLAVIGTVIVRRRVGVETLKLNNEVAGFIYAVVGVLYAVLLGFTAIIVWEQFEKAQGGVDQEANQLADLYRDAQSFPDATRKQLEFQLREYTRLVVEKEWPAMAERRSSPETWDIYNEIWRSYHRFRPENDHQKIWYEESLGRLNQLADQRRLRLLSSESEGVPTVMWIALLGAGTITIGFSLLFGTRSAAAHLLMTSGLALTIALVLVSVLALQHPFSGITRIEPEAFEQTARIFDVWSRTGAVNPR